MATGALSDVVRGLPITSTGTAVGVAVAVGKGVEVIVGEDMLVGVGEGETTSGVLVALGAEDVVIAAWATIGGSEISSRQAEKRIEKIRTTKILSIAA